MTRISFGNRLTPVLLAACVVLGLVVALEWYALSRQEGIAGRNNARPVTGTDVRLTRSAYVAPDLETFGEILERPLFTQDRAPPPQPTTEQASALSGKQIRSALRLEGVALTPAARIAVVRDISSNKLFRLAEGEKHKDWVVESVHAGGATFKRGEQTQELILELDTKSRRKTSSQGKSKRREK